MVNGIKSATVGSAYANSIAKSANQKEGSIKSSEKSVTNQTKVDRIKEQIDAGEYKIEIDKTAKKMAEELIS